MNKTALFAAADMYFLRRVRPVAVYTKRHEHYAAKYLKDKTILVTPEQLQIEDILVDIIEYETHSVARQQSIGNITQRGAYTGHKTIPTPFVQRALNAKNPDRPHRRRRYNAYEYTLENPVKYVKMKLKRHNGCKIANFL